MGTASNVFRTFLGAVLGVVAALATFYGLTRLGVVGWIPGSVDLRVPHDAMGVLRWVTVAALPLGFAAIYATWFDRLLGGSAPARGIKFGVIAWMWFLALALILHYGVVSLHFTRPLAFALVSLAASAAFGLVVGVVYGAGRVHDEYVSGLAYGLPDRRSIA